MQVDFYGKELVDGDKVITIELNGRAPGGDLIEAYYKLDENGKGMLVRNLSDEIPWYNFYKRNFNSKVIKIEE